jgi:hypothetical protein
VLLLCLQGVHLVVAVCIWRRSRCHSEWNCKLRPCAGRVISCVGRQQRRTCDGGLRACICVCWGTHVRSNRRAAVAPRARWVLCVDDSAKPSTAAASLAQVTSLACCHTYTCVRAASRAGENEGGRE